MVRATIFKNAQAGSVISDYAKYLNGRIYFLTHLTPTNGL